MSKLHAQKPKVVFVFARAGSETSTRFGGFAKRLKKFGGLRGVETYSCALEDMVFTIKDKMHAEVVDVRSGLHLSEASFVYFKSWQELADEGAALALFFTGLGVPFMDSFVSQKGSTKLTTHFRLWANEVPVIPTLYAASPHNVLAMLEAPSFDWWPVVIKAIDGSKGENNFLASSLQEAQAIFAANAASKYLVQKYIENDGDYRIGVYGGKARFAIIRKGTEESHLNNTSQGGTAAYRPITEVSAAIIKLAEEAARVQGLEVAGVDIIEDKHSGKRFVLEVNQGSQIVTGAFKEENIAAFNAFLDETIVHRYHKQKAAGKKLRLIGRRTFVQFPEFGLDKVVAKIDTGAYSSSLHAVNTKVENDLLHFDLVKSDNSLVHCTAHEYKQVTIRSSSGHTQTRYLITTPIVVRGKRMHITITLADRSEMHHPVLLGRKVIRSKFLVNVELNEHNLPEWKY